MKRLRTTGSVERTVHPVVNVVNHVIDEWRHHLAACIDAEGGH